ncbi:uroporphyrinogen decarboxylase [Aureimonas fodinaquatilis]|uniref:Uroporphyrinogen decarboxylase n=1 Tax=Aureimonas fodinaquatilis TaxID=2565783 RepID=A0A5B0DP65_9HYPH|nr:uroporphyrinogen decarboxylase [Aureimonas fodinaquatilis]KAA0968246.1 uroporphyrinogen decarboxylase [Aureimonas fodinaquatilis]
MQNRKMLRVLSGETLPTPPIWLMRQAGRYLPEYRAVREKAGSFLDLCYNPELASEVTLQPIRRFGFDAAILFSDILVIPDALNRNVRFVAGEGPLLDPLDADGVDHLDPTNTKAHLAPVIETVSRLRGTLPDETTLIGFCGAPWTVATYMIAGHGTPDQGPARMFGYQNPQAMEQLLNVLADMSADYLVWQLQAGADCVQIFDSWAGILDEQSFERFVIKPTRRLIDRVRTVVPDAKIIGFAKGASSRLENYRKGTGVTALGLDWSISMEAAKNLQQSSPVQGNLDPMRLIAGGRALEEGVDRILEELGQGPLIFNLGHGITPNAPIDHVENLIKRVRNR